VDTVLMTGLAMGPGILPLHASDYLPGFTLGRVFTAWELAPVLALLTLAAVFLYAMALNTLHGRGDRWPVGRTLAFAAGIVAFVLATQSGLAAYDTTLLSAHMAQHMILSMVVPLAIALSAPIRVTRVRLSPEASDQVTATACLPS